MREIARYLSRGGEDCGGGFVGGGRVGEVPWEGRGGERRGREVVVLAKDYGIEGAIGDFPSPLTVTEGFYSTCGRRVVLMSYMYLYTPQRSMIDSLRRRSHSEHPEQEKAPFVRSFVCQILSYQGKVG